MSKLTAIATRLPDHCLTSDETRRDLATVYPPNVAERFIRVAEMARNHTRWLIQPLAELRQLRGIDERSRLYREHALGLGETVARQALAEAQQVPAQVTDVITVSSTGHLMPSLDAHLIERLGLPPTCRRVPLGPLGCAGGAAALGLASALAMRAPRARVLVVTVELPSLSMPLAEPSPSDIIASTQFGDGAAAAVISGDDCAPGSQVIASGSCQFRGTIDCDGVRLTSDGLRLVRPRKLAHTLREQIGGAVDRFLGEQGMLRSDVVFWVIHPRNPELLDAAATGLGLDPAATGASRAVWRRTGNTISCAVYHVLAELRSSSPPAPEAFGMMIAFGAGFGCEMVLLRAGGWLCRSDLRTPVVPHKIGAHVDI